jgi:spermidine synthase
MPTKGWIFVFLFFCSGAAALVYEVVWSKYLGQMFGSTIYAQTIVLAVFMGGLALGNSIFGRKSDRIRSPIRIYAYVELAIGLYAFFFSSIFAAADVLFVKAGSAIFEHSWLLLVLKGLLSIGLLLGPTVLMGGTLPLLATWLNTTVPEAGRRSALFYAVNSLGAVVGSGLAGFYLVRSLGMVATLQLTAMCNAIIGGVALLVSKPDASAPKREEIAQPILQRIGWAGWMVGLTGAISMGLEILASRSLALIFGSSLQAFALVLMSFILGIGLGSAWICRRRTRWDPNRLAILLLLSASAWIGVLVVNIENWVEFYRWAVTGLARTEVGYIFHHLLTAFTSLVLLGIPAALLGSVLPLQVRFQETESGLGRGVGRLLTINTLGAVLGVVATGFFLMPVVGLRGSFLLLALIVCGAAGFVAWKRQFRIELRCAGAVSASLALILVLGGEGWRHVMSSGVFRAREKQVDPTILVKCKQHMRMLFYEDAPDATVAVQEGDGIGAPLIRGLSINGKADASTGADLSTQLLLAHLPLLAKPDSKQVFLLGVGSGISAAAVMAHPVDRLTIAENCQPVLRAARLFDPWNRGVLTNPLVRILVEDARTILKLSPQQYDVVISQPSNPWTVGIGSVFSQEYYELAARRLKPGGMMVQWFHVYDMHDGIVSLVLRTFGQTFPFVEIWDTGRGDIVMLGSRQPWPSNPEVFRRAFERPAVRKDLEGVGILSPEALWARQLASQRTAFAIPGPGVIQRDAFPVLEYEAPKAFYVGEAAKILENYDERTTQCDTAPPEKRAVLQALNDAELKPLFSKFKTVNPDVLEQVRARLRSHSDDSPANPAKPIGGVFWQPASRPQPIPQDVDPEIKELLAACALLDSPARVEGIDRITRLLQNRTPRSDWAIDHYATLAAKAAFAVGDTTRGRNLVRLALAIEPTPQLAYLERVLDREQALDRRELSAATSVR